jgi:hypothetical protein
MDARDSPPQQQSERIEEEQRDKEPQMEHDGPQMVRHGPWKNFEASPHRARRGDGFGKVLRHSRERHEHEPADREGHKDAQKAVANHAAHAVPIAKQSGKKSCCNKEQWHAKTVEKECQHIEKHVCVRVLELHPEMDGHVRERRMPHDAKQHHRAAQSIHGVISLARCRIVHIGPPDDRAPAISCVAAASKRPEQSFWEAIDFAN